DERAAAGAAYRIRGIAPTGCYDPLGRCLTPAWIEARDRGFTGTFGKDVARCSRRLSAQFHKPKCSVVDYLGVRTGTTELERNDSRFICIHQGVPQSMAPREP